MFRIVFTADKKTPDRFRPGANRKKNAMGRNRQPMASVTAFFLF
ncbi:hypothetical protein D1AOALGA4SA_10827 [Olavius algarvensis Delta 1 endosymbiont]|nr:hypothetical protein D1AOALGA4SA_10827 [Olavius algarvensis Delta 1 endosymbiont]